MRTFMYSLLAVGAVSTLALTAGVAQAQDITIATAGPMTGQNAAFGEQLKRGAEMAVSDLNAAGGVTGKKLKLEIGDDACDPKQAVAVANQLSGKKVSFVAGHFCSGSSIPASAVYAENNILMISPASTNPALTDQAASKGWKNVFRTCGRDDIQGTYAGKWLAKTYAGKGVAVIHDKSAYGKGLADETKKAMNAAGVKEAMYESITAGDKDFSALISKMKQANIEAIYFGGYHTEAGLIVRQAAEQGLKAQFVGADSLVTDELWKIAGPAANGLLMTFNPDPRENPKAKDVVAKFKAQSYDPEGYTLLSYAAVQVWGQAVAKAGSIDTAKVGDALRGGTFDTVIGPLSFDAKGDLKNPEYVFYIWKDGKYAEDKSKM
ncbi:MAG: branched-chain amino acid ABC transporter substrate-binding protein [Ferrovibrionaceae bacterium]